VGKDIPKTALSERFVKIEDEPYGNPDLAYSVLVPNDWIQLGLKAETGALNADRPTLLSDFLSPTDRDANAMLQVWCQGLVKEIAAADWLKFFLSETGKEVVSLQSVSPYFADAVATWQLEKVAYTVRVAARVAGNRLFLVQGMAPPDMYADYAEGFGLAVSSFKVQVDLGNPHVELWQTHTLDDRIVFNAPISWPERKPEGREGLDAVELFNLNAQGQPVAVFKAMSLRKSLTEGKKGLDLPALLVTEFTKLQVQVSSIVSNAPLPASAPLQGGRLKVLKARLPKGDGRLRNLLVADLASPTHHVLVGLLTCAPKEGFYEYAVNRRAFDIVLETMRIKDAQP
jgi:hypothetical protein